MQAPSTKIPYIEGYYVYILRCEDDSLYCGWTTQLRKRFYAHVMGKGAKYTKAHRPLELYYFETFADARSARKREYEIKQLNHKEKCLLKSNKKVAT